MPDSAAVIGASGFIGARLVAALSRDGIPVIAASRRPLPAPPPGVTALQVSDQSASGWAELFVRHDVRTVYNLAAYGVHPGAREPRTMVETNVGLPVSLVEAAGASRAVVVHAGSSAEYAAPASAEPVTETASVETGKLYGSTKMAGGVAALALAAATDIRMAVLRLFNVFGPGEAPHRLLPSLVGGLSKGERVALSSGAQVRDFVHVEDAVAAMRAAALHLHQQAGPVTGLWNVATGIGSTVREFCEAVAKTMGAPQDRLGFGDLPMRPDDVPYLVGDASAFTGKTGWRPARDLRSWIAQSVREMSA